MKAEGPDFHPALRYLKRGLALAVPVVGVVAALDLPLYLTGASLFSQQYLALFWGLASALVFLTVPASKKPGRSGLRWYDLVLAALSLIAGIYVAVGYPRLLPTLGLLSGTRILLGIVATVVVLECTRRLTGWPLVIIVLVFILYARFAYLFPGPLAGRGVPWPRLISQLYLGADFLFGTPLKIAAIVVFGFVVFGQFLFTTGGGDFFVRLAEAVMGRQRGGPAKAAVIASSLFGTISGSAVANVASVGVVTIPLMKKTGYPGEFAGAVEAVSGTGGCIMPPVMGAAAFIMAEFLGVPYPVVAVAAIVPAVLYYLGDFMQIHLRAVRLGLEGLPPEEVPSLRETMARGWPYLIPVAVLVYALFGLYLRPEFAALIATAALLVVAAAKSDTRSSLKATKIVEALEGVTKGMLEITIVCGAAGLIVGVVGYTGLGLSLSAFLTQLSGGNLLLLAVLTALVSTILGMGMPVSACYILLAALAAPAMVQLGVDPLLAHLFIFYFGTFSFLTPPVCLAVYAASSIASAPLMATAVQAMRLAVAGYLVPFIFLYKPGLALVGPTGEVLWSLFDGVIATVLLACALEGYLLRLLNPAERVALAAAGILLFVPGWETRVAGLVVCLVVVALELLGYRRRQGAEKPVRGTGAA
ncbi:MAG: TRAP transporter permease [Moorellales bacterium]